jgi:hypothetical protein
MNVLDGVTGGKHPCPCLCELLVGQAASGV